jgi:hypothetical protein
MKCEPYGCVKLNVNNVAHLGLQNVSSLQLKLISTLIACNMFMQLIWKRYIIIIYKNKKLVR